MSEALQERARRLLHARDNWIPFGLEFDTSVCSLVLVACSEVMLQIWETRYTRDDRMRRVVDAIYRWIVAPTAEARNEIRAANARVSVSGDWLSPAWDIPRPVGSDTPADVAGDSIVSAASALCQSVDEAEFRASSESALDFALEATARQMYENRPDDGTDYWAAAHGKLRNDILARLGT